MPPLNLDLHFHRSPDGYRVRLDSLMGQISADFDPPVSAQEKAQGQGLGPQEVGGRIFRALFKGGGGDAASAQFGPPFLSDNQ